MKYAIDKEKLMQYRDKFQPQIAITAAQIADCLVPIPPQKHHSQCDCDDCPGIDLTPLNPPTKSSQTMTTTALPGPAAPEEGKTYKIRKQGRLITDEEIEYLKNKPGSFELSESTPEEQPCDCQCKCHITPGSDKQNYLGCPACSYSHIEPTEQECEHTQHCYHHDIIDGKCVQCKPFPAEECKHGRKDCYTCYHKSLCADVQVRLDEALRLYNELLFAVESKYPGETRHQTALRLIINSQRGSKETQKHENN